MHATTPDFQTAECASVVVDGYNYIYNRHEIRIDTGNGHGTSIAGIIGALRNNESGIAGIAGGRRSLPLTDTLTPCSPSPISSVGVSLYGIAIAVTQSNFAYPFSRVCEAITMSSINDPTQLKTFGLNIMNHSWGITDNAQNRAVLLNEAIHFANRAKVTFVTSRGNKPLLGTSYPACFDDSWVLTVGGTGKNGDYWWENVDIGSSLGNVDIAAPAASDVIYTTNARQRDSRPYLPPFRPNFYYHNEGGTSMAAAHATGVGALLMSYLNRPEPSFANLAPEDVESIVEKTATILPRSTVEKTGFGRLNAGAALQFVNKSTRHLHHFSSETHPTTKTVMHTDSNVSIELEEDYLNYTNLNNQTIYNRIAKGNYKADVYRVEATVTHNLMMPDNVLYSWERHSSSNTLPPINLSTSRLMPHEKVSIETINNNTCRLSGYVYKLSDNQGRFIGWMPSDVSNGNLTNMHFHYSVLAEAATPITTATNELATDLAMNAFPNPINDVNTLEIKGEGIFDIDVKLYDALGRLVKNVFNGKKTQGNLQLETDMTNMAAGIYIYAITFQGIKRKYIKIVKL
jgi:hypothetical protein